MHLASLRSAGGPALNRFYEVLAGSSHLCRFSTLPYGGKDSDEGTVSKDAIRNEAAKEAQEADMTLEPEGVHASSGQQMSPQPAEAELRNFDMQAKPGDMAQPTAAEAVKQHDELSMPQLSVSRPDDMPEGTVPPTRGFDQSGAPSKDSPTRGKGVVTRGPGTSAGTTGAL